MMRHFRLLVALLTLSVGWGVGATDGPYAVYRSESSFTDVMQGLKLAIQERGLYINNVMNLGEMLERTGKDLGMEQQVYVKAESVEFCSALMSRRMAEENPQRVINCPFIISVYALPDEPDTTYIAHRRLSLGDDSEVMREVEAMLESLAKAAAEAW
jgi:uncharacterized protein (DUF302 family)